MRIALFVGGFPTLTETWLIEQVAGLVARGHDLTVFADQTGAESGVHPAVERLGLMRCVRQRPKRHAGWGRRIVSTVGVAALRFPKHPLAMARALNVAKYGWRAASGDLVRLAVPMLERERFDVVHAHHGDVGYVAAIFKEWGLIRDPLITSFHGPDLTDAVVLGRSRGYAELIRLGDLFTAGSRYMAHVAGEIGCDPSRVRVLPQGIDPSRFECLPRTLPSEGPIRMLSIGRLAPVKGIEHAIRAMRILRERAPRLEYTIVGDGPLRGQLEGLITELGVGDRVRILGFMTSDRLAPVLGDAHFLVMPGVKLADGQVEGQGLVLLEAQACGMPVIASRAGGMPEMLDEGKTGLLSEPGNPDALAATILELLERGDRWAEMGAAGRALVEERFRVDRLLDQQVAMYAEVAGSAGHGASQRGG